MFVPSNGIRHLVFFFRIFEALARSSFAFIVFIDCICISKNRFSTAFAYFFLASSREIIFASMYSDFACILLFLLLCIVITHCLLQHPDAAIELYFKLLFIQFCFFLATLCELIVDQFFESIVRRHDFLPM